jgi:hypothetical protein
MIAPVVLQMILCEDARPRKGTRGKFDVLGVVNIIHAPAEVFPIRLSLSVYVCLTDGRGRGYGRITIVDEETEERIFNGDPRTLDFGSDDSGFRHTLGADVRTPQTGRLSRRVRV